MDETRFTSFASGDLVYARARRLHRATTGRTTKRFSNNDPLEAYYAVLRRVPPPAVAPYVQQTAQSLLARLAMRQIYVPSARDVDDIEALGLPYVPALDVLPSAHCATIFARDNSRGAIDHAIAVRVTKQLRRLRYEQDAMRAVGLHGRLLHQVTTTDCDALRALAKGTNATDYVAEAATAAKQLMRRIHKSETHGDCSFGNSCRLSRRRYYYWGQRKPHRKVDYGRSDYDDELAGEADAMDALDATVDSEDEDAGDEVDDAVVLSTDADYDFCEDPAPATASCLWFNPHLFCHLLATTLTYKLIATSSTIKTH
ncbi:hypothetical protein SPRG_13275 [Saprolegnia parasitica CBS 223.65]|uniref:Uncharacterized protein n=1 Tax=Saprolegnia parasitica (strain CBS 223.65) TaxID=695850 RepID=A0A067BXL4_SAPPC|nr:hypothetical protein SPRG_13275 [Saprolegnia parasitica CBS 223.65]KDO21590.1 hypothetical protein SPRG_13275 [Saprolegnia parasitica CBS 223.65]|eukprot:XP_012207681.1 hypothetical protein SPRG_13275 [Saprolegnia parasitica CBS 223.65]